VNELRYTKYTILMTDFETPVLLLIFNRPRKTQYLIDALEKVRPKHIFIMADGPRKTVLTDQQDCKSARDIATHIPWECEVHTNFLEDNIGCDQAVPLGIDWFFENVEEGIILEDDCIPDPTFFSFCEELLEHYRSNKRVMHISGNNFQNGQTYGDGSYYFSLYSHSWGWATWKRAWTKFHPAVSNLVNYKKENRVATLPLSAPAQKFWMKQYLYRQNWDSLWQYTIWYENGASILPNKNLVTNIGFDNEATHTRHDDTLANLHANAIAEIHHPSSLEINKEADNNIFDKIFHVSFLKKVFFRIRKEYNRI